MGFSYTYQFEHGNEDISVVIDHDFCDIDAVEEISRFPHSQRRSLGRHVMENYASDKVHSGALLTIQNPFVRRLGKLFGERYWFYWTKRHLDTLILFAGLAFIN